MPRRTDIARVLLIGSGPIVIGQACEFDYSGTQACLALREEGYEVILVNSNPATIMTDPGLAHRTYVEPLTPGVLEQIIARERPDALLPTMGGQTALNLALALHDQGILERFGVQLIGAQVGAIRKAEDRQLFKDAMARIGCAVPKSRYVTSMAEAREALEHTGLPVIIRPSFTLGGAGGAIAWDFDDYLVKVKHGMDLSPVGSVLVEESVLGWKEYELEVMRDRRDNVVIVCSIENLDPMGIHTGDSITVAPAQTLTDKEYQWMRDQAIAIIREIGVETGGSNIQFAVDPKTGRQIVIEMNPRVSRSSALASKVTGFAIARIATKLAIGYSLDELPNEITGETMACFEPSIDYVVTKIPRFAFEKFPGTPTLLSTQMKSVGEVMAIGRTFQEALQKALRSLETGIYGLTESDGRKPGTLLGAQAWEKVRARLATHDHQRILLVAEAFRHGMSAEEIAAVTAIDPWFLHEIEGIIRAEQALMAAGFWADRDELARLKAMGFSDRRLAQLIGHTEATVRAARAEYMMAPVFKTVDTCAAEFVARTPYHYSTHDPGESEHKTAAKPRIVILGGGPNRIGQGIEFDYCCVHGVYALQELGYETVMINCNPETVSTDYDTADRLYFEPLTLEDVLAVAAVEKPVGVIVQFGGQTPLKLARGLEAAGVPIIGTPPDAIDRAEDRERFNVLVAELGLKQPPGKVARSAAEARVIAAGLGYPVLMRPSYVLGGRAMELVHSEAELEHYIHHAVRASEDHPVLIDRFLDDAIEVDVDAVCDGAAAVVTGVMEHVEEAGIHSGDSACFLPPASLSREQEAELIRQTSQLALALGVKGLINVQFAIHRGEIYVLEVNPRASRTIPFVSKATGVPWAGIAAKVMAGKTLAELGIGGYVRPGYTAVKETVLPFEKFPGADTLLGPEMKSTGEVMGIDDHPDLAFFKAQLAAGNALPDHGAVFISVRDADKPDAVDVARTLDSLGYGLVATTGTCAAIRAAGLPCDEVAKVNHDPAILRRIERGSIAMIINTTQGKAAIADSFPIRQHALRFRVPYFTTAAAALAAASALLRVRSAAPRHLPIQEYHARLRG